MNSCELRGKRNGDERELQRFKKKGDKENTVPNYEKYTVVLKNFKLTTVSSKLNLFLFPSFELLA